LEVTEWGVKILEVQGLEVYALEVKTTNFGGKSLDKKKGQGLPLGGINLRGKDTISSSEP